ncbi:MAG: hypothetical protein ACI4F3_07510 [Enterocloster sp.]
MTRKWKNTSILWAAAISLALTAVQPGAITYGAQAVSAAEDRENRERLGPGVLGIGYRSDYTLYGLLNETGLSYCEAIMYYNEENQPVKEKRPRQDGSYGLLNYFGLSDDLCRALYGEDSAQIGTGEEAVNGDSLLALAGVTFPQDQLYDEGSVYRLRRDGLAAAVREYMNSFEWRSTGELERAKKAALYIASGCVCDLDLYDRFKRGEDVQGDPSFTAYGCLVDHKAVCEGLAIGYQLLVRATGLAAFCAPDAADKDHMYTFVRADGNWYKVDLAVVGISPQTLTDRCFSTVMNAEAESMLAAYENRENPYIMYVDRDCLAPGKTWDISGSTRMRNY